MNEYPGQHHAPQVWKHPMVLIALVIVGYWLWTYHSQHLLGWLPYVLLALCPLMHIFMHGGHGSHNHHGEKAEPSSQATQQEDHLDAQ